MAEINPLSNLSYTNKDFQEIYPELLDLVKKLSYKWDPTVSNESDPGVLLLKLCAIVADKNNYNIDKNVLECFPLSVTQESNARQLFEQLGYNMHWYKGGTTKISLAWIGEKAEDSQSIIQYTLPRFTMVSDDENSVVYTLTDEVTLTTDGATQVSSAIQGVAVTYTLNGDDVISPSSLDSNNRLYFTDTNVAENGIFIQNDDGSIGTETDNFGGWASVQNLAVEPLGKTIYKFGVTQNSNNCYIEFPEDAESLMGQGVKITYIQTDGANGNIASKVIDKFYNDTTVEYNDETVELTSDNVQITNVSSVGDGADPETIDSAYKNYKKTVGTFNTLVTLRDYTNAINESGFVSNGFVCDRTNDIQTSYGIISFDGDLTKKIMEVETNPSTDEPYLDAFDLKLYALQYISSPSSATDYNNTFDMLVNDSESVSPALDNVISYISDSKSIQHDFQLLLRNKICMIKNKYPIICKIIPQYRVTDIQASTIRDNVKTALYNKLNSEEIDFGEEITYDTVYNTIIDSDERIKAIVLESLDYTTYAVYYDGTRYNEVRLNTMSEQYCGYYNSDDGNFYATRIGASSPYTYSNQYVVGSSSYPLVSGYIYTDISTDIAYLYNGTLFTEYITTEFQNEIYAKSVLNGNTQILNPDTSFDYSLNQKFVSPILSNISRVTTNANIQLSSNTGVAEYTVKDGEHIFLYAPNLIDETQYSTYVRFQYILLNNIDASTDYMLKENESITFYWKETDDDDANYVYYKYGTGTILSPSFSILASNSSTPTNYVAYNYATTLKDGRYTGNGTVTSVSDNDKISALYQTQYTLTSTKSITTKKKNETVLNSATNFCYWILNTVQQDGTYRLFASNDSSPYVLQSGEYFMYTNAERSELVILGSGTKISRTGNLSEWKVESVDYSKITENGVYALEDVWFTIPSGAVVTVTETQYLSINAGNTFRMSAWVWEQDATYSATGTELTVAGVTPMTANIRATAGGHCYNSTDSISWTSQPATISVMFSNSGCTITSPSGYTLSDFDMSYASSGSSDFTSVPSILVSDSGWEGKSVLNLKVSPTVAQRIYDNQSIEWEDVSGNTGTISAVVNEETYILSDYGYDMAGGINLDVSRLSTNDVYYYMNLYKYTLSESSDTDISYESGGTVSITFDSETDATAYTWIEKDSMYGSISTEYKWVQDATYSATGTELTVAGQTPINQKVTPTATSPHYYNSADTKSWTSQLANIKYTVSGQTPLTQGTVAGYAIKAFNVADNKAWVSYSTVEKSIEFNLPLGTYITPVMTSNLFEQLTVSAVPYNGNTQLSSVTLSPIYNSALTNLTAAGTYPLKMDLQSIYETNAFTKIVMLFSAKIDSGTKRIYVQPVYKYTKPIIGETDDGTEIIMGDGVFTAILSKMIHLDEQSIYDYTYVVEEDNLISNPLLASSFFDQNHIYNKFTICQIDTPNTDVSITNKIK